MEKFNIHLEVDGEQTAFEVICKNSEWCEFEVYRNAQLTATFQPDQEEHIRVYLNVNNLPEVLLGLIGTKIETYYLLHL